MGNVNPPQCFCVMCCVDIRRYSRFCHRCEVSLREALACPTPQFQTEFMAQLLSFRDMEERRAFVNGFYRTVSAPPSVAPVLPPWHVPSVRHSV